MVRPLGIGWLAFVAALLAVAENAICCPFCSSQSQTFTEEIDSMDVAAIVRLIAPPAPVDKANPADVVSKAKFEVIEPLKGAAFAPAKSKLEALYYGNAEVGKTFLIMAVNEGKDDKAQLVWSTPISVSPRSREYLTQLFKLPKSGAERLEFFQAYLEDKEEILARDAFDEFAKAPYDQVRELKSKMKHDQLLKWIKDTEIPASRRRLYLTMLGVCGTQDDLPMLAEMLKSDERKYKSGLDALIACYLTLKGPDGMPLIEDLFLKNPKSEYPDTYAAIMALRFHGSESEIIPQKRLVLALRCILERPAIADLVIPDLARWEDWDSLDKLVELFRNADEKSIFVRPPVVMFVRACPLPEAKEKLKELEKIDPAAVKRANTFFPFGPPKPAADVKTSSSLPSTEPVVAAKEITGSNVGGSNVGGSDVGGSATGPVAQAVTDAPKSASKRGASANAGAAPAAAAREKPPVVVNHWAMLGVTALSAAVMLVVQWTLLTGGRR
jgi:hypothetical protein